MILKEVTLANAAVTLVPLSLSHTDALRRVATDGELWNARYSNIPFPGKEEVYIQHALNSCNDGSSLAFAVMEPANKTIIGTTRLYNYDAANSHIMLGYTWYAKKYHGTKINPACKLLLMTHAFETLGCEAVEFQLDSINHKSLAAVKKLGAIQDGILRHHKKRRDGSFRDTVSLSIISSEWPHIKLKLEQRLG
jgi:N-acetyltransferase